MPQVAARKAEEGEEELGEGGRKVGVNPVGRRTQNLLHLLRVVPVVVDLVPYQPDRRAARAIGAAKEEEGETCQPSIRPILPAVLPSLTLSNPAR